MLLNDILNPIASVVYDKRRSFEKDKKKNIDVDATGIF